MRIVVKRCCLNIFINVALILFFIRCRCDHSVGQQSMEGQGATQLTFSANIKKGFKY